MTAPFSNFFFQEPPDVPMPALVPDYRMHAGKTAPEGNRDLQLIQQWAEAQRANAIGLYTDFGRGTARVRGRPNRGDDARRMCSGRSVRIMPDASGTQAVCWPASARRVLTARCSGDVSN